MIACRPKQGEQKAYPNPSTKYVESSCTAGVTRSGEWLRLHPLPFRMLDLDQRFKKYEWIRARIRKSNDPRPESHAIDIDSIRLLDERLSTEHNWSPRIHFLDHLRRGSLEEIREQQFNEGISLGFFRPQSIDRLVIRPASSSWTEAQLATLRKQSFFEEEGPAPLEKVPYDFSYSYRCSHPQCRGHEQKVVDWEIYQPYRTWKVQYGDQWEEKLRQRYEHEMQERFDTHFFVGTMRRHPKTWIIVGLFYPPNTAYRQDMLFTGA